MFALPCRAMAIGLRGSSAGGLTDLNASLVFTPNELLFYTFTVEMQIKKF